ncbi:MAG: glutamate--tRNA ligase [Acidimicrobiales bacterium]
MTAATRLRFAPAPTGYLHLGSARTALFNWLYARHTGGEMILRIEDTNVELSRPELIDNILESLEWLGIDWDGEPVRQSTRTELYLDAIETCLSSGAAYRCACTRDDLVGRVGEQRANDGYDGHCRERNVVDGPGVAVRFRSPDEGITGFDDIVRGRVEFANADFEDFVIRRGDGSPTFIVANAVDDADLGITHVVRGEDLLNPTPRILLVRDAIGVGAPPQFAHLPIIVNDQRKKLSKRRDDVSLSSYRDQGILPEAMVNYLALLGWGPPDDVEVRPISEIVELFELSAVNSAPATWDLKKLTAINGDYIRGLDTPELLRRVRPIVDAASWGPAVSDELLLPVLPLVQERLRNLNDLPAQVDFLFLDEPETDEASWNKAVADNGDAAGILSEARAAFAESDWTSGALHAALLGVGEARELKLGKTQAPVRVAVTGRTVGPPLFESLVLLGRDITLSRIDAALSRIDS